ncbi:unnamed protein product [Paramecium octaurelia]|uniref:Uncharacterized protein n=1 Tax=Paramecium octaurelia TaxID=43137 RepID=A0A8S1VTQ7_PAROT|nr:unnamed protein product [Paramecium octaurelia]
MDETNLLKQIQQDKITIASEISYISKRKFRGYQMGKFQIRFQKYVNARYLNYFRLYLKKSFSA